MTGYEREGYDAGLKGKGKLDCPYQWTSQDWWRADEWEKGRQLAQDANEDDDD